MAIILTNSGSGGSSSRFLSVVSKTTTYTVAITDDVILCSGSAFTVTLPSAATSGRVLTIKKTDSSVSNIITIARAGSDLIDGQTSVALNTQYEEYTIVSDGVSNWEITSHMFPQAATAYTASWGGSISNPSIGNGTQTSYFWREKDGVRCRVTINTGSTTSYGSGTYTFSIPNSGSWTINASETYEGATWISLGTFVGSGATKFYTGGVTFNNATTVRVVFQNDGVLLSDAHPESWAGAGNVFSLDFWIPITGFTQ